MRNREDWILQQLEKGTLNEAVRSAYEAELDAIAEGLNRREAKRKEAEATELKRRAEIRARIEAEDMDYVWTLGEAEFKDDYEIVPEGDQFVLYSKVARDDQNQRRPHATMDAANSDLRYLYWNRLYTKYVRTGAADAVVEVA